MNNGDLISREALKKRLGDLRFQNYGNAIIEVMEAPAVDAVEVVRCRDCKHLMFSDCYGECGEGHMGIVSPDDFCSYGRRKEGAENG